MTPNSSSLMPHIAVIGAGYWSKNLVRNFHPKIGTAPYFFIKCEEVKP